MADKCWDTRDVCVIEDLERFSLDADADIMRPPSILQKDETLRVPLQCDVASRATTYGAHCCVNGGTDEVVSLFDGEHVADLSVE